MRNLLFDHHRTSIITKINAKPDREIVAVKMITVEGENTSIQQTARRIRVGKWPYNSMICCIVVTLCCFIIQTPPQCRAFAPSYNKWIWTTNPHARNYAHPPTLLHATQQPKSSSTYSKKKKSNKQQTKYKTIGDMMKAMKSNPDEFLSNNGGRAMNANGRFIDGKKKPKRSRKRVDRPKQKYIYASQRKELEVGSRGGGRNNNNGAGGRRGDAAAAASGFTEAMEETEGVPEGAGAGASMSSHPQQLQQQQLQEQLKFLRSLGLNPSMQVSDPVVGNGPEELPKIIAAVRVDGKSSDDTDGGRTSNSFAYVMYKPVGWSILGDKKKGKKKNKEASTAFDMENAAKSSTVAPANNDEGALSTSSSSNKSSKSSNKRVKAYDEETDDFYFVEYDESDVLAMLTPEERAELTKEGGLNLDDDLAEAAKGALAGTEWDDGDGDDGVDNTDSRKKRKTNTAKNKTTNAAATANVSKTKASINSGTRPSLVNWLKQRKANEGTPIKGGKNWVALAGATDIDDSGLVFLCPRDQTESAHVDSCNYVAVVGNGKKLASRSKLLKSITSGGGGGTEQCDVSTAQIGVLSRLKRARNRDPVSTVSISFPDGGRSTCSHAALLVQDRLNDGVRGDPLGDPLDRRASRRMVHCESMAVSSLANLENEPVVVEADDCPVRLPDDMANYAYRGTDGASFAKGSFLGRREGLGRNGLTNAYREVNGASDGFPGWIVDRYDRWLFVQHHQEGDADELYGMYDDAKGPLPSLHDGYTAGVYYLPTKADRSVMGTSPTAKLKPTLLEGTAAPEYVPILENGITYQVNLGESFSTGIFLDQRLQRAWLADRCDENTSVLNCFAHTGAFSVAAATRGAKTLSLDLDKKWLDRIRPQMEANGVTEWDGHHDCIYGDCFDWLARLAKRGDQFDIVILDPPSTSVGGKKKKRWSVKNDMAELVSLAAPLVKSGGLLFTTTNSASLPAEKFAKMCKKGLSDVGAEDARLERVSPMPSDFASVGMQPVKNLVWRVP